MNRNQIETHGDEYHDGMVAMLELVWGKGFMAPGGEDNVRRMVSDLDLRNKLVLDIGSGLGGGDIVLARDFGARVIGIELEAPLIERANRYVTEAGLDDRIQFRQVVNGPLEFDHQTFDLVYSSGAFTQIADKPAMFAEVHRVLKPGGVLTSYDWMRSNRPYSDDMLYWFRLEGLTYAMETPETHHQWLEQAGFRNVKITEDGGDYRRQCREEYNAITGSLEPRLHEALGSEQAAHFKENWRVLLKVLEAGDVRPAFFRAVKPTCRDKDARLS